MPAPRPGRRALLAALLSLAALLLGGCDHEHALRTWSPNPDVESTRGRATTAALRVLERAARSAEASARGVPGRCRSPWPQGAFTVRTTLRLVTKPGDAPQIRLAEESVWRQDPFGNVAHQRTVRSRLYDGREATRSRETRVLGERSFVAIDGRFAETSRDPTLALEARAAAGADVDLLGSLVTTNGGQLLPYRGVTPALCPPRGLRPELDPIREGTWETAAGERRGWLRWEDRDGRRMVLEFSETTSSGAAPVEAPETLHPIDADRSFAEVRDWLEEGSGAGWFAPAP